MLAETVFQSIDSSINLILFLTLLSTILLWVIAARLGRLIKTQSEIGTLLARKIQSELKPVREEPLPPPLTLDKPALK